MVWIEDDYGLDLSLESVIDSSTLVAMPDSGRLPFRVRVRDPTIASYLFARDGPEIRCDDLSSSIDAFTMNYEAEMTTPGSHRKFYDHLFSFARQICHANGFRLEVQKKTICEDAASADRAILQPDVIVKCNDCVVLCGEERDVSATMNDTMAELRPKMKRWSSLFSGGLSYLLGFVTRGKYFRLYAFRQEDDWGCPLNFELPSEVHLFPGIIATEWRWVRWDFSDSLRM
ncbi:hypothetical protein PHYSODRAFT_293549 [Phytophthora sojae]|uniref:Uncharacterized protein n=1 Tax=Phytophthora sojae (strain P6497) TaxID=1094619 RepID=G4YM48_PHYSP|nr:hypothetical protein PHYSODRAFT_293549 [Phytophthora sojae]EGZ27856.1 hypothetical protein PHYSODRAFT_293549 [Phytophthora sojae]|eukprot:XP_009515131.1 hypothetical protein PHYSODRAFT_293549 [Phytophthora sojae]